MLTSNLAYKLSTYWIDQHYWSVGWGIGGSLDVAGMCRAPSGWAHSTSLPCTTSVVTQTKMVTLGVQGRKIPAQRWLEAHTIMCARTLEGTLPAVASATATPPCNPASAARASCLNWGWGGHCLVLSEHWHKPSWSFVLPFQLPDIFLPRAASSETNLPPL